jgi:hypothetical protein
MGHPAREIPCSGHNGDVPCIVSISSIIPPPPNNTTRFTNAYSSLTTSLSWLIVVCFVVNTMRPLPWARGTTLSVRSPMTATAARSLKMSLMAVACHLPTRQLHRRIPLPCNVIVMVDCCVFCRQQNASPPVSRMHCRPWAPQ